ncbi:polymer-forming cytoskeletal protein [uncultured Kocuria sp.]|uniref:polymer-forming cytoskeletal protein n=1 Tax=uncultured Kocuria sp. TaxID=259305 RepID=UPI002633B26D|nr:polymer-forming cytoskeletal protein [uncultured Kocuria sp.]
MTSAPTRRTCPLLLVLLLLGLLVTGCSAPADTGRYSVTLITQQHHVVDERQILVGDTVVAGGTVVVAEDAEHRGSLTVLAGEVRISGRVAGDLTVLGGTAALTGTAEITGDVAAAGGALTREPGTMVRGSVTEEPGPATVLERSRRSRAPAERALWSLAGVAVMAGLAWLAARLAPRPLHRTAAAATAFPVISGALGTLVLIAALPLVASMIFTLFLIPVAGIVLLGLGAITVYGLLAAGRALGDRILHRLGRTWSTPRAAALGTAVLVAALQVIGLVPVVGAVVTAAVLVTAVGAVLLTRFGLRPYTPPDDGTDDGTDDGGAREAGV